MNDLNFLTVDLFLYDLCDGLGKTPEKAEEAKQRFWQRLYPQTNDAKPANIKERDAYFADYVELLAEQKCEFFADSVDGYYYPVQLADTYALQVDSSGEKENAQQASSPQTVQSISTDIVQNRIRGQHGQLGESWLIWGQLSDPTQNAEATAKDCYKSLATAQGLSWKKDYVGQGSFDGALLYELQQPDTFLDGRNNNHHVLICLFPADHTQETIPAKMGQLYRHLIRLFHNRSKVLWLYEESRRLKSALKQASDKADLLVSVLPNLIQSSRIDLRALQQHLADALVVAHIYEKQLNYLRDKEPEITTNLASYRDRLTRMATADPTADLTFLNHFETHAQEKYLRQIQADSTAFNSALKPLGNFIQTIQGITDIERTQNERVLNQTVAIAGVGVSMASLTASSLSGQADKIIQAWRPVPANQPPSVTNLWLSAALVLLVSIAIGSLAALMTAKLVNRKTAQP